jgi:glycosyltransferase involved in cell wall biosynthesis
MCLGDRAIADMRVLVVHNRYLSAMPSGENRVVDDDVRMLRDAGYEAQTFFRDSDAIAEFGPLRKAALAGAPTYAVEAVRDFRRVLTSFRPDIVHLHNPFPLISPSVVRIAAHARIPVVQTVHNFRHSCLGSTSLFRDGRTCEDCVGKLLPWPGVVHGCYRGSRAQSLSMAVAARAHRATWQLVDRFLAVSNFVAYHLTLAGISSEKIVVRPNSTPTYGPALPLGSGFVFVGRLTPEKGVSLLMAAWEQSSARDTEQLVVAGDGPERNAVMAARQHNVRYEGLVDSERVRELLNHAAVVVIPSLCYEGFPRVVAEAFERGRPVAATALGSLRDLITPDVGWTADPNVEAFAAMLGNAASDPALVTKAAAARAVFEASLTSEISLARLLNVYAQAQAAANQRSPVRGTPSVQ